MRFSLALPLAVLLLPSIPVSAQKPATSAADSTSHFVTDSGYTYGRLADGLRRLKIAEERYWAEHGTYTTDLSQLGLFTLKPPHEPSVVWLKVLFAGGRTWSGNANYILSTPENDPSHKKSCVIYVGNPADLPGGGVATDGDHVQAPESGQVVCDQS